MTAPNLGCDIKARYALFKAHLIFILKDLDILSGNSVSEGNFTWQDVAKRLAGEMRSYANLLDSAAEGNAEPFLVFPDFVEAINELESFDRSNP